MARSERILGHGRATVAVYDGESQEVSLDVCIPSCTASSIMPILVAGGVVADVRLATPVVAWAPGVRDEDLRPEALARFPGAAAEISHALRSKVEESVRAAIEMMMLLQNPAAVLCMLPMGTYVEFNFRAAAAPMAAVIDDVGASGAPGGAETAHAMAGCLAWILEQTNDVRCLPEGSPPGP